MDEPALEMITGAVLSDAQLSMADRCKNASFYITLSGGDHMDWLWQLWEASLCLKILSLIPTCEDAVSKGRAYKRCRLHTRVHPTLTELWHSFYASGRKEVPLGFSLTPIILANWFMGDGGVYCDGYAACFATESYSVNSIEVLWTQLSSIGIEASVHQNKSVKNGAGLSLWCTNIKAVKALVGAVKPYVVPSYRYKLGGYA